MLKIVNAYGEQNWQQLLSKEPINYIILIRYSKASTYHYKDDYAFLLSTTVALYKILL